MTTKKLSEIGTQAFRDVDGSDIDLSYRKEDLGQWVSVTVMSNAERRELVRGVILWACENGDDTQWVAEGERVLDEMLEQICKEQGL